MKHAVFPPNPIKGWTAEDIKSLLDKPGDFGMHSIGKALVAILARQTFDEQSNADTKYQNGVGFNAFDAPVMTSMAEFYRDRGYLSPKQLAFLRSGTEKRPAPRIHKYAGQLAEIANSRVEAALMEQETAQ